MKSEKEEFYIVRNEEGEKFEIKASLVQYHLDNGYELVQEEPVLRETNTSAMGQQEQEESNEKDDEKMDEVDELHDPDEMSYNELQSFVSKHTEDYSVVGKSTEELAQKAKEVAQ